MVFVRLSFSCCVCVVRLCSLSNGLFVCVFLGVLVVPIQRCRFYAHLVIVVVCVFFLSLFMCCLFVCCFLSACVLLCFAYLFVIHVFVLFVRTRVLFGVIVSIRV